MSVFIYRRNKMWEGWMDKVVNFLQEFTSTVRAGGERMMVLRLCQESSNSQVVQAIITLNAFYYL